MLPRLVGASNCTGNQIHAYFGIRAVAGSASYQYLISVSTGQVFESRLARTLGLPQAAPLMHIHHLCPSGVHQGGLANV